MHFYSSESVESEDDKPRTVLTPNLDQLQVEHRFDVDAVEAIAMLQQPGMENHNVNLEVLLSSGAAFPPLLDIPPDADDETMVELAIALSLQEHEMEEQGQQSLHGLQVTKIILFHSILFIILNISLQGFSKSKFGTNCCSSTGRWTFQ